jgi:hypothetical protein
MKALSGSLLVPVALAIGLSACDRSDAPIEPKSSAPQNTAAPTAQFPARPQNDVSDPGKGGVEVTEQKGTEAGGGTGATEEIKKKE